MIPQANIIAWRANVPWVDDAQVEQDLVLSRAAVELFADGDLAGKIALRGGTSLHKLFLQSPHRYSEDIDLVQTVAGPIGSISMRCVPISTTGLGNQNTSAAEALSP